jgi:transcriptional regulator with XRE-family HTH domain
MEPRTIQTLIRRRAESFKSRRLALGLSIDQMAAETDLDRATLFRIESGETSWSISTDFIILETFCRLEMLSPKE